MSLRPIQSSQTQSAKVSLKIPPALTPGRFAEKHVPLHVRNIILAESGANDGLGFPFLYLGLYLILIKESDYQYHTIGGAVLQWCVSA